MTTTSFVDPPSRTPPGPAPRSGGLLSSVAYGARMLADPIGVVGGRFAAYGDIYYAPSGGVGLYVLRNHAHVKEVLVTRADDFEKKHTALESLSFVLGSGLLTSDGDVWRRHRRLANPAFARQALDGYVGVMIDVAEDAARRLGDGGSIDMAPRMTDLTLRVVGRTLFGTEVEADIAVIARAMSIFQTFLVVPSALPALLRDPLRARVRRAQADLHRLADRLLASRRAHPIDPPDLAQMLLDASDPAAGGGLTEAEVRDEILTFLLAGHETTSNTLAWSVDLLARSAADQRRVRDEVRDVVGDRPMTPGDVPKLAFTSAVVKEALRLYPPAYVLARRASREVVVGDYTVPAGSEIVVWTYFTHRDPVVYPEPEAFRPERFLGEAEAKIPRFAFVPFGAGPRACIGRGFALAEAVVALAALVRRWSFAPLRPHAPKLSPRITLAPRGGVHVRLTRV